MVVLEYIYGIVKAALYWFKYGTLTMTIKARLYQFKLDPCLLYILNVPRTAISICTLMTRQRWDTDYQ